MTLRIGAGPWVCAFLVVSLVGIAWTENHAQRRAPDANADVAEAFGRLQRGDAVGAGDILEKVVAADPTNARAWRLFGIALQQSKSLDRAIQAYKKSLELEPGASAALYNLGIVYALKQDKDTAFDWLARAKATRKVDMTQIEVDGDLASLRTDPRFKTLLPTPEDFKNPFVETVKVLREWDGEAANDQFGWIARPIGDVDGDGAIDIVTSAPTKMIGGEQAGRVYVYSTRSGRVLWSVDGKPGDQLGLGVEAAGDVNRDGVPDVIASAPGSGHAYVYSGRTGRVLLALTAGEPNEIFGRHVAGVGDIDHDGFADVMVGAPGNNAAGKGAGRAYVYSGKTGRLLLTLTGERAGDGFGSAVAGASDPRRSFLVVGAPAAGPQRHGRVYVYDGLKAAPKFVTDADESGSALGGMFVSVVGDVDRDGVPDIFSTDFTNNGNGPAAGRAYVNSGATGARLMVLDGETPGERFGIGLARAGDVDRDGHADLIVGSWQYAGAATSGGRAYLFSGKDGHVMKTYTCRIPGDTFGFDTAEVGDVDGDGATDFLITSAWSGIHGFHSGRIFIVSSADR